MALKDRGGADADATTPPTQVMPQTEAELRERLRIDPAFRQAYLGEAIASFAFEGVNIPPDLAERCLDDVLSRPPVEPNF